MKVVIAGGSGFLGNALAWAWAEESHDVRVLTRSLPAGVAQHESGTGKPGITRIGWTPDGHAGSLAKELDGAAAVINLAGESIDGKRWSAARKQALRDSRILATKSLVAALAEATAPPPAFVSASAVGYYGDRGAEPLTEGPRPATTSWRACASTGRRKRPPSPRAASSCSAPGSCSSDRAASCPR